MVCSSQDPVRKAQKRKSNVERPPTSDVQVQIGESSSSAGPAFVNFPSVRPSKSTPFTIYCRDTASTFDLTKRLTLIAGETEDVEFFSTNRHQPSSTDGADCSYLPALYDPSTSILHIHPSAPLYLLVHRVKRLKNAPLISQASKDQRLEYRIKRNDLGEVFGTRKAKSQIRAEERNRVDVGAMQAVKGHLMESIGEKAVVEGPVPPPELIPIPNLTTSDVSEVYPRDNIIPPAEYSSIDVFNILHARDDKGRSGSLPWRRSRWIEDKMRLFVESASSGSTKKASLRMCYYLATLHLIHDLAPQLHKTASADLAAKFPGVPLQLLDGCLSRFAEPAGKRYTVTEKTRTKLLAWICVVYLSLNDWSIPVGTVASDLKLPPGKVGDIFKSLGCKVEVASPAEREKAGLSLGEAQKNKRAVLKAPVVFPQQKRRGPVKR